MTAQIIDFIVPVAFKDIFDVIAPAFEKETGHRFRTALMLNPEVPGHIERGCSWSIAMSNPQYIHKVMMAGNTQPTIGHVGHSPLSFGVLGQDKDPPIQSREAITDFLRNVSSIAVTDSGTSGSQFDHLLDELDIRDAVGPKVQAMPGGGPIAALLAGSVEVAALPLTNIAPIDGVRAAAICPASLDVHIDVAFCLHKDMNSATHRFAAWLQSPERDKDFALLGLFR